MIEKKNSRIELIDAVRGIAVVLMVVHHLLYDLVAFLGAPAWLFSNPVFDVLHYIFAGLFIFLAGVSSRFSRSNIKRGLLTAVAALLISAVTYFIEMPIMFGVLHLLAFCMLLYGLLGRFLERIPKTTSLVLWAMLLVVSQSALQAFSPDVRWLWPFGWTYDGFYSSDYFPVFPWVFVFLLGTVAGAPIRERRLPEWFYSTRVPVFPIIGRHAFVIYLLHQPVLYGITMLLVLLIR